MKHLVFLLLLINAILFSQQLNEDELFSEDNLLSEVPIFTNTFPRGVFFTGNIESQLAYSVHRDTLANQSCHNSNSFAYGVTGDIFIDIREDKGYKTFVNLGFVASSSGFPVLRSFTDPLTMANFSAIETNAFAVQVKELFVDFPLANLFYLRFGKQFLAWGTTYFWNPTDLINQEKKNLNDPDTPREGTWGIKLHIPYKTIFNWYNFVDMTSVKKLEDAAIASRLETVVGNTEVGICGWWQKGQISTYGADISTRLFDVAIKAEGSLSYRDNRPILETEIITTTITNYVPIRITNTWVYRIALNISRFWELFNVKDRLYTMVEFFYNSQGTNESLFKDSVKHRAALASGSYIPNEYSRWYALFFFSIRKFFFNKLSLKEYVLWNIEDHSAILSSSLMYIPVDTVNMTIGVSWRIGEEHREYTAIDFPLMMTYGVSIKF